MEWLKLRHHFHEQFSKVSRKRLTVISTILIFLTTTVTCGDRCKKILSNESFEREGTIDELRRRHFGSGIERADLDSNEQRLSGWNSNFQPIPDVKLRDLPHGASSTSLLKKSRLSRSLLSNDSKEFHPRSLDTSQGKWPYRDLKVAPSIDSVTELSVGEERNYSMGMMNGNLNDSSDEAANSLDLRSNKIVSMEKISRIRRDENMENATFHPDTILYAPGDRTTQRLEELKEMDDILANKHTTRYKENKKPVEPINIDPKYLPTPSNHSKIIPHILIKDPKIVNLESRKLFVRDD